MAARTWPGRKHGIVHSLTYRTNDDMAPSSIAKLLGESLAALAIIVGLMAGRAYAAPERPLVFIPGILGSELSTPDGQVVWGGVASFSNFDRLDMLMGPGPVETLRATGLVKAINVLGPFWTIHQYDGLLAHLAKVGYVEGRNLFVFPYDWRRSNFDTANDFGAFVAATPALSDGRFDLLAHSMGGLVAKAWMLEGGGASKVRKAVYMGTPFRGSMNALAVLSEGWGPFKNLVAGGMDTVRRVSLSFASLYELMPAYANCCRIGSPGSSRPLDLMDPATWRTRDWLPPDYVAGAERSAFFDAGLARAARMRDVAPRSVPGVDEVMFAGDVIETQLYLYVPPRDQGWRAWTFSGSRGDGTVPVWSAANDWGSLVGSEPTFGSHATIFEDPYLLSKLDRVLLSDAPPPVRSEAVGEIRTRDGTVRRLDLVRVDLAPALVPPGGETVLTVVLEFRDNPSRGDLSPLARVSWTNAAHASIALMETTTADDVALRRLTFAATVTAPRDAGTHRMDVEIPGQGVRTTFLTVAAQAEPVP